MKTDLRTSNLMSSLKINDTQSIQTYLISNAKIYPNKHLGETSKQMPQVDSVQNTLAFDGHFQVIITF